MESRQSEAESVFRETMRKVLALLPADYKQRKDAFAALRIAFHQELAAGLEASLNKHTQQALDDVPEHKKQLARDINNDLRELGLSVACPRSGAPSILVVTKDRVGEASEATRFRFVSHNTEGHTARLASARLLPTLALIPAPQRIEPLSSRWTAR